MQNTLFTLAGAAVMAFAMGCSPAHVRVVTVPKDNPMAGACIRECENTVAVCETTRDSCDGKRLECFETCPGAVGDEQSESGFMASVDPDAVCEQTAEGPAWCAYYGESNGQFFGGHTDVN